MTTPRTCQEWLAEHRNDDHISPDAWATAIWNAALASLPGEPVAWQVWWGDHERYRTLWDREPDAATQIDASKIVPLYLHPAPVQPAGKVYPACKGTSCGCTDGVSHSPECHAEHDALCNDCEEPQPAPVQPSGDVGELVKRLMESAESCDIHGLSDSRDACLDARAALLAQQAEIGRLKAECAALRADAERLDYLIEHQANQLWSALWDGTTTGNAIPLNDLRDAIDAARKT
jgi:hypothetical protein